MPLKRDPAVITVLGMGYEDKDVLEAANFVKESCKYQSPCLFLFKVLLVFVCIFFKIHLLLITIFREISVHTEGYQTRMWYVPCFFFIMQST